MTLPTITRSSELNCELCGKKFIARTLKSTGCNLKHQQAISRKKRENIINFPSTSNRYAQKIEQEKQDKWSNLWQNSSLEALTEIYQILKT